MKKNRYYIKYSNTSPRDYKASEIKSEFVWEEVKSSWGWWDFKIKLDRSHIVLIGDPSQTFYLVLTKNNLEKLIKIITER